MTWRFFRLECEIPLQNGYKTKTIEYTQKRFVNSVC
jgi:hypothetical protein